MLYFKNFFRFCVLMAFQMGLDIKKLICFILSTPGYLNDYYNFKKIYKGKINIYPQLHDKNEEGGAAKSEYFWQDLIVARWIFKKQPRRHVDIGSRVDGFVGHVACFMDVEVFDVRPINSTIPGVKFIKADFMDPSSAPVDKINDYCDSLSCLHAVEHFGLGRYGDPLSINGLEKAIKNMSALLSDGGTFYISTPVGNERVLFNSHWIFSPKTILNECKKNNLQISKFFIFNKDNQLKQIYISEPEIEKLSSEDYNLGIFIFIKVK